MKRPAFQFYPSDWRKDPALSACSMAARGLWIELMCIAHEADNYGHLEINGKAMTATQLARMVGESPAVVAKLVAELDGAGVFSRTAEGVVFSRRMVKDERIRNTRSESGRLGGNPNLFAALDDDLLNQTDNHLLNQTDNQTDRQKPTPSSSSSSSSSSTEIPDADASPPPSLPSCPHLLLIESFSKLCPELPEPKPELWQGKNADAMRARWKWVLTAKRKNGSRYASTTEEAVDWFERYFGYVSRSDFLSGRNGKWTKCNLGWLVNSENFAKVVQGQYANKDES